MFKSQKMSENKKKFFKFKKKLKKQKNVEKIEPNINEK